MPAEKQSKMDCPKCDGEGKIPLTKELQMTLDAVRELGPVHAERLKKVKRWRITANGVSNRLSDLLKARLVLRHKKGRFWMYTAN